MYSFTFYVDCGQNVSSKSLSESHFVSFAITLSVLATKHCMITDNQLTTSVDTNIIELLLKELILEN